MFDKGERKFGGKLEGKLMGSFFYVQDFTRGETFAKFVKSNAGTLPF